jgi:hypothetical protein
MIDTDKYEGHIENIGRWQMFGNALPRWAEDADRKLVADAPLLLAEVKRLREQLAKANKYVHNICQHSDSMMMDYEDYMNGGEEE